MDPLPSDSTSDVPHDAHLQGDGWLPGVHRHFLLRDHQIPAGESGLVNGGAVSALSPSSFESGTTEAELPEAGSTNAALNPAESAETPSTEEASAALGTEVLESGTFENSEIAEGSSEVADGDVETSSDGGDLAESASDAEMTGRDQAGTSAENASSAESANDAAMVGNDEIVGVEIPQLESFSVGALQPPLGSVSLDNPVAQSSVVFQTQGQVNSDDLYTFSLNESGVFSASLTGLSGDADVQLIEDKNANGKLDRGEILAWQWERGSGDESIRQFLEAGDYIVRVASHNQSVSDYQLATTFTAAPSDDRAFDIEIVQRSGLAPLSADAMAAIDRAADFWNGVISHSSFDRPQTLTINLFGRDDGDTYLAFAGPQSYQQTPNDRLLPSSGSAVINTSYANLYNDDPDYLESVMRHELGHVLGFGVVWSTRGNDLVDRDRKVYREETYAAQAYGELLGEFQAVEIPLDDAVAHWQEAVFDAELMTPRAELPRVAMPLSQVTIAAIRDIGWNVNYGAAEDFTLPRAVTV